MSLAATNILSFAVSAEEDPLALLPRTPLHRYGKSDVIYSPQDCHRALYLIIEGRVKVSRLSQGAEVVLDIYGKDDFFGEAGYLGSDQESEQATALENASLMHWMFAELKQLVVQTPALGAALLRMLAQKLTNANQRIGIFCLDPVHRRLVKTLLDLSQRLGQPSDDQMLHLAPITHEDLARHVGTSREVVTQYMNQLRRKYLLQYSRRGIDLDVAALKRYLAEQQRARDSSLTSESQPISRPTLVSQET